MRILIDADGCPVVNQAIRLGNRAGLEVILLCDTSHVFQREGARTITVSKGADSVDFALVNLLEPGDVAVTQDYGLAAMCLARGARAISQDGLEYQRPAAGKAYGEKNTKRRRAAEGKPEARPQAGSGV